MIAHESTLCSKCIENEIEIARSTFDPEIETSLSPHELHQTN